MENKKLILPLIFSLIIISGSVQAVHGTIIPDPFVDIINPGPSISTCGIGTSSSPLAQSFIPTQDNLDAIEVELLSLSLQSIHPVIVNVYDGAGTGGALLRSTSNDDGNFGTPDGNNFPTAANTAVVRFEFASPFSLTPGNTYTIEVADNDLVSNMDWGLTSNMVPGILEECGGFGAFPAQDYVFATYYDPNFVPNSMIGGELSPIITTALLIAGAKTNAAWLIPIIVSGVGIGLVFLRTRT